VAAMLVAASPPEPQDPAETPSRSAWREVGAFARDLVLASNTIWWDLQAGFSAHEINVYRGALWLVTAPLVLRPAVAYASPPAAGSYGRRWTMGVAVLFVAWRLLCAADRRPLGPPGCHTC